jgi:hypothetical protein
VQNLGARVLLKMGLQLVLETGDLAVQALDEPGERGHDHPVGGLDALGRPQLLTAKRPLDLLGASLQVALASRPCEPGGDLGTGQAPAELWGRCELEHRERIGRGQLGAEGLERLWAELPKRAPQSVPWRRRSHTKP